MRIRNPGYRCLVPGPGHGELEHILLRHVLGPAGQRLLQQHSGRQQPHRDSPNHATKRREENEYKANKNYKNCLFQEAVPVLRCTHDQLPIFSRAGVLWPLIL